MRYLLTGHSGFIGKSVKERLWTWKGDEYPIPQLMVINRDWEHDLSLVEKIKCFSPHYIIHCAAEIKDYSKAFKSNVEFTNWLLEVTHDVDYKAFVNLGSSSEYGLVNTPMREDMIINPRTMYEATKGASTILCQGYARQYNKPVVTIRPFSVYGEHEPSNRLIPTLFRNFKNGERSTISKGNHDFIHIDDFLDGLFLVLNSPKDVITADIVNLGSGVQYSNLEVFNHIKDIFNSNLDCIHIDNIFNTYDSDNWVADIEYAKTKYGFSPKHSLKTGLTDLYERCYK